MCGGGWAYHTVTTSQVSDASAAAPVAGGTHRRQLGGGASSTLGNGTGNGTLHARFSVVLHTGDAHYLTRRSYAPLKLVPPYGHTDMHAGRSNVEVCNIHDGEIVYFGLKGGAMCAEYELHVHMFSSDLPCHELEHSTAALANSVGSRLTELFPDHFVYGSCEAGGYVDHVFNVNSVMAEHKNLLFEVEDRSKVLNTDALGVFLYDGAEIPSDRQTEHSQTYTADGIYALAVSVNDLHAGKYFLSVRCTAGPVRFKVIAHEIEAVLEPGDRQHGVICPGEWVHHKYTAFVADHHHLDAVFNIELHTGDLNYVLRSHSAPITLAPPFHKATAEQFLLEHKLAQAIVCDTTNGTEHWLGLQGGHACADYDIWIDVHAHNISCTRFAHEKGLVASTPKQKLARTHFAYSTCQPHSFQHFYTDITETESKNNLVIQVEDMQLRNLNPTSLRVMLFDLEAGAEVPLDPNEDDANQVQTRAAGRIWAININYLNLHAGRLIVSVQCGASAVRFRAVASLVHANLLEHEHQSGMMFPDSWIYHYFEVTPQMVAEHASLKFEVVRYTGEIYMVFARQGLPPGFASNNDFELAVDTQSSWTTTICTPTAGKMYYGLYGGEAAAEYDIIVNVQRGGACDTAGLPGYPHNSGSSHRRLVGVGAIHEEEVKWWMPWLWRWLGAA